MSKFRFKAEDFNDPKLVILLPAEAARIANAILDAERAKCPKILRLKNGLIVSPDPVPVVEVEYTGEVAPTHRGILFDAEEL